MYVCMYMYIYIYTYTYYREREMYRCTMYIYIYIYTHIQGSTQGAISQGVITRVWNIQGVWPPPCR